MRVWKLKQLILMLFIQILLVSSSVIAQSLDQQLNLARQLENQGRLQEQMHINYLSIPSLADREGFSGY